MVALCACSLEEFPEDISGLQPQAIFSINKTRCIAPCNIAFQSQSVNVEEYLWDFGDGTTSTESSPVHEYVSPGEYEVVLQVKNITGEATKATMITIIQGITYTIENSNVSFRDFELFSDNRLLVSSSKQIFTFQEDGSGPSDMTSFDFLIDNIEINQIEDKVLSVGNTSGCNVFRGFDDMVIASSRGAAIELNFICEQDINSTFTDMTKLPDNKFAMIGVIKSIQFGCVYCPPAGGDLVTFDDNQNIIGVNKLATGEITNAYSVKYFNGLIYLGGTRGTCIETDCNNANQRFDNQMVRYTIDDLSVYDEAEFKNPNFDSNGFTDIAIGEGGEIYAIGQSYNTPSGFDPPDPLADCGGSLLRVDYENETIMWEAEEIVDRCILPISLDVFKNEVIMMGVSEKFSFDNSLKIVLAKFDATTGDPLFEDVFKVFDGNDGKVQFDQNGQIVLMTVFPDKIYKLTPDGIQ